VSFQSLSPPEPIPVPEVSLTSELLLGPEEPPEPELPLEPGFCEPPLPVVFGSVCFFDVFVVVVENWPFSPIVVEVEVTIDPAYLICNSKSGHISPTSASKLHEGSLGSGGPISHPFCRFSKKGLALIVQRLDPMRERVGGNS
jgi:hypothetical protein